MLDKLEMFLAVAKAGHFGRAAASLGITQPTLSTGIKHLEGQLGVQLIFRGSRYGGLTPEGQIALEWARRIVGDARQLREEMRAQQHGLSGQLRLAVIPTALRWASVLIARFRAEHPNVRFSLLSRNSDEIVKMLDNLDADAGLSYIDNEPLGHLSAVPLYRERYVLVSPKDGPFSDRKSVKWGELDGVSLCLLSSDMQNRRIIDGHLQDAGVKPQVVVASNSTLFLVAHVLAGDGMAILPEDSAHFLAEGKPLDIIALEGQGKSHDVGLLALHRDPHTPVLQALLATATALSDQ